MSRLPPVSAHVLVIEDDPDIRRDMVALLEGETGMEALEILDEGPEPCLALLDLMLPVMKASSSSTPRANAVSTRGCASSSCRDTGSSRAG